MVEVSVGDHDSAKARIGAVFKPRNRREKRAIGFFRIQGLAEIQKDALVVAGQLDAGASDLVRTPADASPEAGALWSPIIVGRICQRTLSLFGDRGIPDSDGR